MLEKPQAEPKSDPRIRRTRQMIQQAMNELMAEKSFVQITVQDITKKAGVNRATFYAHYVDKYDLVNAIIRDHFQTVLNAKLPAQPHLNRQNVALLMEATYSYLENFPGQCSSTHLHHDHRLMVQQVQTQLYNVLLEWIRKASETPGRLSPEVVAMSASWSIFGSILQALWQGGKRDKSRCNTVLDEMMIVIQAIFAEYLPVDDEAV